MDTLFKGLWTPTENVQPRILSDGRGDSAAVAEDARVGDSLKTMTSNWTVILVSSMRLPRHATRC